MLDNWIICVGLPEYNFNVFSTPFLVIIKACVETRHALSLHMPCICKFLLFSKKSFAAGY